MVGYLFPNTHMSKLKAKSAKNEERWYDVNVVVELLIHETQRGETYAPEIGNLSVGFSELTPEKLAEELEDMRTHWPSIFPKNLSTGEILTLIRKKYAAYEDILALRDVV